MKRAALPAIVWSALVSVVLAVSAAARPTNGLASVEVGNPASEKASCIALSSFGQPQTKAGQLCRNTDETPAGDGKGGWATFSFPSAALTEKAQTYLVEVTAWGKSEPFHLRLRDTRKQRKKDGEALWADIPLVAGKLSKTEAWNQLTYSLPPERVDPKSATQAIGLGGGDTQIWIARIALRVADTAQPLANVFPPQPAEPVAPGDYPTGVLVAAGKACATIILPANADAGVRYAAADLQEVFQEMTGVILPVADNTQATHGNRVLLGDTQPTSELLSSAEKASLGKEEFLIRQRGRDLAIAGGGPYGVIYGCAELYERLGARWYLPGELGACVPKLGTIRFENLNVRRKPSFAMRLVGDDLKWNLRLRSNAVRDSQMPAAFLVYPSIYHSQEYWLPDKTYFAKHPEFYALIDGQRSRKVDSRKLCNSNPEVAQEIAKNMAHDLRAKPYLSLLSLSPTDGRDSVGQKVYCQCPACRALDQPDYALLGEPVPSDYLYSRRQMVLYNNVATELAKEFPDRQILVGAYANYTWPPKDPTLHGHTNLAVIICRYENYCYAHPVGDPHCEPNQRYLALIKAWQKQTPHIYFYEYFHKSAWLNLPWPIVHSIRADISLYRELGVEGLYTQYNEQSLWPAMLPMYIAAQLLWDHTANVDALLEEFYQKFYGEAAAPMKRYHQALENAMANGKADHIGYARKTAYQFFTEDLVAEISRHLRDAQALATTDLVRRRLERVAVMTEYTERLARYYRLMAKIADTKAGPEQTKLMLEAYNTGESLRVDVRDHPQKFAGIVNPGWLVNDISEGRTIRNLRKTLIGAGAIQATAEDKKPQGKRRDDVPEANP